ncbi:hypothetical protein [Asanoa iriomotensis]|uniref:Uncharacterized protein n=1 Tax=Asanoa iriomotensis TaxID=234613 RepID=A0ABQ4CGK9_9ACTN|nr:hypothetical protein [Asanoa iriomotensis]GIF61450.1 hypothetical protein Air01nite_75450 [Asanoa iriomotensis]
MSRLVKMVLGVLLAGAGGWGIFLATQGLDKADKWSSVVGLFVSAALGVAGLVIGWLGLRQAGGGTRSVQGGGQLISDSTIGGDNINIGRARDVNLHRRG